MSDVDARAPGCFPLTYVECRARFLRAAGRAGARVERHPIEARGPDDERLSIDVARLGDRRPARMLVVMSGVHGIEGFAGSAIQTDSLGRAVSWDVPPGCGVMHVHAVNPWGMAWWRRQNESNVDLNRNWVDFGAPLPDNPGYRELHRWLCPDVLDDETERAFLDAAGRFIEERGYAWVKEAVTVGQYEFEDGLYYGGHRREASTQILEAVAASHLSDCEELLIVDLHTGHGAFAACTLLSGERAGTPGAAMVDEFFAGETVERTLDNPDATTAHKRGQLTLGICEAFAGTRSAAVTLELGTVDDTTMILAERREHWLQRKGDFTSAEGSEIAWGHRVASIPDDRSWEASALAHGERVLTKARAGLFRGRG